MGIGEVKLLCGDTTRAIRGLVRRRRRVLYACAVVAIGFMIAAGQAAAASRTVRVGIYQNEPKVFVDENGRPSGLFIELLEKIAAQEGWKLVYVP